MPYRPAAGQVATGVVVTLFGVGVLYAGAGLPIEAGYAGVGPGAMPLVVGIGLTLLGVLLTWQAWHSGFDDVDEPAERAAGFDWPGFLWVSAAILAYGLLVERAGFVLASTLLFAMVARGFGSRRVLRDLLAGLVVAGAVYLLFAAGLNINLPAGVLGLPQV
ncbi:MAG: tripartite tricarboxylate transporter TctB family protein [Lautropia sp.]